MQGHRKIVVYCQLPGSGADRVVRSGAKGRLGRLGDRGHRGRDQRPHVGEMRDGSSADPEQKRNGGDQTHELSYYDAPKLLFVPVRDILPP
jgi:hypothetical protein